MFLNSKYQSMTDKAAKRLREKYESKEKRFAELDKALCRLYEDNVLWKIPDSRYKVMSQWLRERAGGNKKDAPAA